MQMHTHIRLGTKRTKEESGFFLILLLEYVGSFVTTFISNTCTCTKI